MRLVQQSLLQTGVIITVNGKQIPLFSNNLMQECLGINNFMSDSKGVFRTLDIKEQEELVEGLKEFANENNGNPCREIMDQLRTGFRNGVLEQCSSLIYYK